MNSLKNKRVAVFGLGVSGVSAVRLLKALDIKTYAINGGDFNLWPKSSGVLEFINLDECISETDANIHTFLKDIDLVILSPGIPRDHEILRPLLARNAEIWGEIELAYRYLNEKNLLSPMIGITGTNGKTTTTTFLGEVIEHAKRSVFVGGNIGIPFCDYAYALLKGEKKKDFILLELSSFQLESIFDFKVDIAMILNIFQNHGERYEKIEDYAASKFLITNHFTETSHLIVPNDQKIINDWSQKQKGHLHLINPSDLKIPYDLKNYKLPGHHNRINLAFVVECAEIIGLDKKLVLEAINAFNGVHHRIENVSDVYGLGNFRVFNDAKSTNWDATITATKAMMDFKKPIHLIIGGKKRGHGDSILPHLDFLKDHVAHFYLIGEMSSELESELSGKVDFKTTKTLEETLKYVRENFGKEEGVLLFSPAFPSFDQFQNYAKRGEAFVKLVQNK